MKRILSLSICLLLMSLMGLGTAWGHPIDNIASPSLALSETIKTYVAAGIHHIFIGPDHILFVISLILAGGTVRQLLRIITAFTIAHSITLSLAVMGVLIPSPRVIEPLIALSIVCVAVDNLFTRKKTEDAPKTADWRPIFAFGFGLVHGFGFASVLQDFGLPRTQLVPALISFNGGVEIGQAVIVLTVTPLLLLIARKSLSLRDKATIIGSMGISLTGTFWFLQRLLTP
jgi:hydrogenase/urease accessory protein HupE